MLQTLFLNNTILEPEQYDTIRGHYNSNINFRTLVIYLTYIEIIKEKNILKIDETYKHQVESNNGYILSQKDVTSKLESYNRRYNTDKTNWTKNPDIFKDKLNNLHLYYLFYNIDNDKLYDEIYFPITLANSNYMITKEHTKKIISKNLKPQ